MSFVVSLFFRLKKFLRIILPRVMIFLSPLAIPG